MARADQTEIRMRIVIEKPVPGVMLSLQEGDDKPLDPKASKNGEALVFELGLRVADGPKFFGPQVRREGPTRRFIYIRIGQSAGQHASAWSRRMKLDIHDIAAALLERAKKGGVLQGTLSGTGKDGTPACATIKPIAWKIAP